MESGNHSPVGLVMARGLSSKVGLLDMGSSKLRAPNSKTCFSTIKSYLPK